MAISIPKSLFLVRRKIKYGRRYSIFKSVLLGYPLSGKSTFAKNAKKYFDVVHLSSGVELLNHVAKKTRVGMEASKYIKEGKLVPDDVMIKFIASELKKVECKPWLLDGFPRTLAQAKELWKKENLDLVINLVVPPNVIMQRVEGRMIHLPSGRVYNNPYNKPKVPGYDDNTGEPLTRREDDKPEVVKKRLELYEKMTRPVIEFYRQKGILKEFKGDSSDVLTPQILKLLSNYIKPSKMIL